MSAGPAVDPATGQLYYPDGSDDIPAPSATPVGGSPGAATQPLSSVPALSSDPQATVKLYLNFVGAPAFNWAGTNVPTTPAYDVDGDPSTFSSQELLNIRQIWTSVAEAYSTFNVDVTTVDPSPATHTYTQGQVAEAIIGGNNSWTGENVGGLSYTYGFRPAYSFLSNVSFVFPSALSGDSQYIADATEHELGHQLGLVHQSVYSGTTLVSEYNYGSAAEGPVMGDPYYDARATWYYGQDDSSSYDYQDDIATIASAPNGFGYRPDAVGQSIATATPLAASGTSLSASGVVEQRTDGNGNITSSTTDTYSFTTGTGSDTLSVNVAQYGATLHAQEWLYNSAGQLVTDADTAGTLGQTITANLTAGTYYLVVGSYGSYGDVGQYTVAGTVVSPSVVGPTLTLSGAATTAEGSPYTLGLTATDPGHAISGWSITWGDGTVQAVNGDPSSVTHTYAAGTGPHTYTVTATATDDQGTWPAGNALTVTVTHVPPTLSLSGAATVAEQVAYTLGLAATDAGHTVSGWAITWGDGTTQTVTGHPPTVTHTYAAGPNAYTISATATDDVGTYAAGNTVAVSVTHTPPTLTLSGAATVGEGLAYTLGLSATDPGHAVTGWTITWGDGTVQNLSGNPPAAAHTYATGPHNYTVTATATDDAGTYAAGNAVAVAVTHVPPTLALSGAATVAERATYTLGLSVVDVGHAVAGWAINWGDGTTQAVGGNPSAVTHTYAAGPHNYTVSATATDDVGTYPAGNTVAVAVTHVPPALTISGSATAVEGQAYTLGLSAVETPGHAVTGWSVNWGDGTIQAVTGTPTGVTHTYPTGPANFTVTATATDDVGTYPAGNSVAVSVTHATPGFALAGPAAVPERGTYALSLLAVDTGHPVLGWSIHWGDGTTQAVTGSPTSVTHAYAVGPNAYTITATATDDVGTYAAANGVAVTVTHVPPTLAISGPATVAERATYTLGLSAVDVGHAVSGWAIAWGDGTTQAVGGTPAAVTHAYAVGPNTYTVTATATDDVGTYAAAGPLTVAVTHVPPTLAIAGPPTVAAQAGYTLGLSAVDPGHAISGWAVNWGDGTVQAVTGTPSAVTHTYAAGPHAYTVSATATDDVGTYPAANTVVVAVTAVSPTLVPTLSGPATVAEGTPYTLGLSATDPGHVVSGWSVTWGDGTTQAVTGDPSGVTHTYAVGPNAYTISATATDDVGTYAAVNTVAVAVTHVAPTLTVSGPATVAEGAPYTLTLAAVDPGHAISGWAVNWGDGTVQPLAGNPASVTHAYAAGPNAYTITATATDDVGTYPAADAVVVAVTHVAPLITLAGPPSVAEGATYTLELSAVDPGHTVSGWTVNWGDGTTQGVAGDPSAATHTYATGPHGYTITATATDDAGTYAAANAVAVAVTHVPPVVSLGGAPVVVDGSAYTLSLSVGDPGHAVSGWSIHWGDGTVQAVVGTPATVPHTFPAGLGTYNVTATVTDDVGTYAAANSLAVAVVAVAPVPPVVQISGPSAVDEGTPYVLALSAVDPGGTVVGWSVDWGDGTTDALAGDPSAASHVYAAGPNHYTVTAAATDASGTYPAAAAVAVSVSHVPPTLTLSGASTVAERATYTLGLAATDPGHAVAGWTVDWGDGTTQAVPGDPSAVTHAYAAGGRVYTVTATATDDVGTYPATDPVAVAVTHLPPTLAASGAPTVAEGTPYALDLSAIDPGHAITGWTVTWGDGTVDSLPGDPLVASHTYASGPNTYNVTAAATDDAGAYAVVAGPTVAVTHVPPVLTISGSGDVAERATYTLDLSATDPGHDVLGWAINWGDGTVQDLPGDPSTATHAYADGPTAYGVTATATDDVGTYEAAAPVPVAVLHVPPTVVAAGPPGYVVGSAYVVSLSESDPGHAVQGWTVTWGDGSVQQLPATATTATHVFADGRPVTISAALTDDVGTYAATPLTPTAIRLVPASTAAAGQWAVGFGVDFTSAAAGAAPAGAAVSLVAPAGGTAVAAAQPGPATAGGTTTVQYLAVAPPATAAGQAWQVQVSWPTAGGGWSDPVDAGTLTVPPPPTAIASPAHATPVAWDGSVATQAVVPGSVSAAVPAGSYYTIRPKRTVDVALTTTAGDAPVTLQLLKRNGKPITSVAAGTAGGLHATLARGVTYYVRLLPTAALTQGDDAAYELNVANTFDTRPMARQVGPLPAGHQAAYADTLSAADPQTFYALSAKAPVTLSATVDGLTGGPVVVQILTSTGQVVRSTTATTATTVTAALKAGQTYYVRLVGAAAGATDPYTLELKAGALAASPLR